MPFQHLREFDQSYWSHFKNSIKYSGKAFLASGYFLAHAFVPDVFTKSGSSTVEKLRADILSNQQHHAEAGEAHQSASNAQEVQ